MGQEQAGSMLALTISDMSGGLNTGKLTNDIEDKDATDCRNVYWYDGQLRKIFGDSRINTAIGGVDATTDITGIFDFQRRDGIRNAVVTTDNGIYRRNVATWTSILGTHTASSDKYQFIAFNDLVLGCNYTSDTWSWNGIDAAITDIAAAPRARWIASFNGRAWLADVVVGATRFRARAYFSALNSETSFDTVDDFLDFETDDAQAITGIMPLGSKLVVYKEDSIGIVSGYGLGSWTVDRDFITGIGCISGYTIVQAKIPLSGRMTSVHIFLSEHGVYAFDGSSVYRLSKKVQEYLKVQNQAQFPNAVAAYYQPLDQYWLFHAGSEVSQNNRALVLDLDRSAMWPMTTTRVNAVGVVEDASSDLPQLWFGDYNATIRRLDEGSDTIEDSNAATLITNGTMEADANWTSFGSPTTNERSGVQFFNGTFARRAVTDAVSEGFYQDITTVSGSTYRVAAVVRVVSGDVIIRKEDTDATDVVESTAVSLVNTWSHVVLEFTATATTSRIIFMSKNTAASEFYVDDVVARIADIDGYWYSKWYDMGDNKTLKFLREVSVQAQHEGNHNLTVGVRYDFSNGTGNTSTISLNPGAPVYGTGTYDQATDDVTYTDANVTFNDGEVTASEFNHIQTFFRNQIGNQPFRIEKFNVDAQSLRRRFVHNAA